MADDAGDSPRLREAAAQAEIGYPVLSGGRMRLLKRLIGRLAWPFLRHQVAFNHAVLSELTQLRETLAAKAELGLEVEALTRWLAELEAHFQRVDETLSHHFETLVHHSETLVRHESPLQRHEVAIGGIHASLEDVALDGRLVRDEIELSHQQSFARFQDGLGMLRTELSDARFELNEVVQGVEKRLEAIERSIPNGGLATRAQLSNEVGKVRLRLSQIDLLLNRVRRVLPSDPTPAGLQPMPSPFEGLYAVFEDAMRGSEEEIRERVAPYVVDLASVDVAGPVLDVGSGRGELLELLAARGIEAYGVEINPEYVERGAKRGLDVRLVDARSHLAELEPASLRAVTAVHVVEHLPTEDLIEFLDLAARAVAPGGLLILETPNPGNVLVGASSFYLDPTHKRPVPSELLAFLVEARGFTDVEVRFETRYRYGVAEPQAGLPWSADLHALVEVVNQRFFEAHDYAVVARRP